MARPMLKNGRALSRRLDGIESSGRPRFLRGRAIFPARAAGKAIQ